MMTTRIDVMRRKYLQQFFLVAATVAGSSIANATLIDFTDDSVWGQGSNLTSPKFVDYGDLRVTLSAYNPGATTYTNVNEGGCSVLSPALACVTDGIGIADDEITFVPGEGNRYDGEMIKIDFNQAVDIEWIGFLDLFIESGGTETAQMVAFYEDGSLAGNGFEADQVVGSDGWLKGNADNDLLGGADFFKGITSLEFFADYPGNINGPANTDFALAAIKIATVPEPGSLTLLGLGLAALGFSRRKQS